MIKHTSLKSSPQQMLFLHIDDHRGLVSTKYLKISRFLHLHAIHFNEIAWIICIWIFKILFRNAWRQYETKCYWNTIHNASHIIACNTGMFFDCKCWLCMVITCKRTHTYLFIICMLNKFAANCDIFNKHTQLFNKQTKME